MIGDPPLQPVGDPLPDDIPAPQIGFADLPMPRNLGGQHSPLALLVQNAQLDPDALDAAIAHLEAALAELRRLSGLQLTRSGPTVAEFIEQRRAEIAAREGHP